jgi:hypothetical protein
MVAALKRHRGPFTLKGWRLPAKPGKLPEGVILATEVDRTEVLELAETFLTDPRDTLTEIEIWSEREDQHCGTVRKADVARKAA